MDAEFINNRRLDLDRMISTIVNEPALSHSDVLYAFLMRENAGSLTAPGPGGRDGTLHFVLAEQTAQLRQDMFSLNDKVARLQDQIMRVELHTKSLVKQQALQQARARRGDSPEDVQFLKRKLYMLERALLTRSSALGWDLDPRALRSDGAVDEDVQYWQSSQSDDTVASPEHRGMAGAASSTAASAAGAAGAPLRWYGGARDRGGAQRTVSSNAVDGLLGSGSGFRYVRRVSSRGVDDLDRDFNDDANGRQESTFSTRHLDFRVWGHQSF